MDGSVLIIAEEVRVPVLYVFGFSRLCIAMSDLYFQDPDPLDGQDGPERGVRLELRLLERGTAKDSIYAATPIAVGQPVWRADFLEAVDGRPFDRTHHHPVFTGWDPGDRVFVPGMSADPLGWLMARLADLDDLLAEARFPAGTAGPDDATELRRAAPQIVDTARVLLDRVRAGELGAPPRAGQPLVLDGKQLLVRSGWL
jgi:hypothetical protein